MNVLSLFAGIGGFDLGLERAGMRVVAQCEIEPFCQKVLAKHWPDVPCYADIRELTKEQLDADGITTDLICGGYPCQPFSQAGKRQGEADDRHLWPEMYRLIETIRPRWVLAENVAGHITMGLDDVLADLEAAHYAWWTFVIPACAVDARHRRDRVWIVANRNHAGSRAPRIGIDTSSAPQEQRREYQPQCKSSRHGETMADTGIERAQRTPSVDKDQGRQAVNRTKSCRGGEIGGTIWSTEPNVGRVVARISYGLDDIGGRLDGYASNLASAKGITKDFAIIGCLRILWQYGELAEAPSQLRRSDGVRDTLQEVSLQVARGRKNGIPYEEMRHLWNEVSAQPLKESQDVFKDLLVRNWKTQCDEALGQRVNRLKSLGNAVVPQVVEQIGRAIMEAA